MKSLSDHQIPTELSPPEAIAIPSLPSCLQERYGRGPTLHTLNVPYSSLTSSTVKTEHRSQSPTSPAAPESPSTHCPCHPGPLKHARLSPSPPHPGSSQTVLQELEQAVPPVPRQFALELPDRKCPVSGNQSRCGLSG